MATKDLRIDYYKRLRAGAGRSQALRKAQLDMLKDASRAQRRAITSVAVTSAL
jgi:hypothetical protein